MLYKLLQCCQKTSKLVEDCRRLSFLSKFYPCHRVKTNQPYLSFLSILIDSISTGENFHSHLWRCARNSIHRSKRPNYRDAVSLNCVSDTIRQSLCRKSRCFKTRCFLDDLSTPLARINWKSLRAHISHKILRGATISTGQVCNDVGSPWQRN